MPPVIVSAIAGLLFVRRYHDESHGTYARCIGMATMLVATLTGQLVFLKGLDIPDTFETVEVWQWLMALMVPMALAIAVQWQRDAIISLSTLLGIVVFHVFLQLAMRPIANGWEPVEKIVWMSSIMTFVVLWFAYQAPFAARAAEKMFPMMMCVIAGVSGVTFALQTSSKLGLLTAAMSAALGPLAIYAFWGRMQSANTAARFVSWMLPGFWLCHYFYSIDVPVYTIPLLALAGLTPWVGLLPFIERRAAWQKTAIQGVLMIAALAGALVPAVLSFEADPYAGY